MTVQKVRDKLNQILYCMNMNESEIALKLEDSLAWDLIVAIANENCDDPKELCTAAVMSRVYTSKAWGNADL